jgi:threonine/homoserine/homoserine lactone efflux protein
MDFDTVTPDAPALRMGFMTNALNPKTSIFIVSLFTQIVAVGTPLGTRLAYGGFISFAHLVWFSVVALFFGAPVLRRWLLGARRWIDGIFGLALIAFGLSLAFSDLTPG